MGGLPRGGKASRLQRQRQLQVLGVHPVAVLQQDRVERGFGRLEGGA